VLDDRLFGPGATNFDVGRAVGERRNVTWLAPVAEVVDPHTLRRAACAVPAGEVGKATVHEDVARIASARVGVAKRVDVLRAWAREGDDGGAERAEQDPHVCLDVRIALSAAARFNTGMASGYVGILSAELHFPEAGSLKGKRKHVKSAKAQLQQRFGASVAEVDHHDLWQRARLTLSCVSRDHRELRDLLDAAERYLAGQEYELGQVERRIVSLDD
jgi:uncharacterized protein